MPRTDSIFYFDVAPLHILNSLVETQVLEGIREYQAVQDRMELLRGVASGKPASQIVLSQRRR